MVAAATVFDLLLAESAAPVSLEEEEMSPPRRPSRPDPREARAELPESSTYTQILAGLKSDAPIAATDFENWTAKELSARAVNATLALAHEVGRLATIVASMEARLASDYEDTKTRDLRALRQKAGSLAAREKWFKGIITTVVGAIAVAEALRWLGLGGAH